MNRRSNTTGDQTIGENQDCPICLMPMDGCCSACSLPGDSCPPGWF